MYTENRIKRYPLVVRSQMKLAFPLLDASNDAKDNNQSQIKCESCVHKARARVSLKTKPKNCGVIY